MTKSTIAAFRRADRLVAIIFLLAASFSAGLLLGVNAAATDKAAAGSARADRTAMHSTTRVALRVEDGAFATRRSSMKVHDDKAPVASVIPASFVSPSSLPAQPLNGLTEPKSAAEMALLRVLADQRCLADAMYYEARGEGAAGEEAIAEVVFHRTRASGYPHSICGVVYEGASLRRCQFSFACNGETDRPKEPEAWYRARMLAAKILAGAVPLADVTEGAISFHAVDAQPGWDEHLERTIQIGNHIFYRRAPSTRAS
jgi:spore germination cell wall hydrolase CwlJ-like protein